MSAKSMKDVLKSGNLKTYMDPRLIRALGHPFREHLLACFSEEVTSATRIGEEFGTDSTAFYKHVELLERLGFIEEVDSDEIPVRRRRGNRERFFRAREAVLLDASSTQALPSPIRNDLIASQLMSIWDEAAQAVQASTFDVDGESHLTWMPGLFDKIGWQEAIATVDHALYRLMEIRKQTAERLARSGEQGLTGTFAMLGFGTPHSGFPPS